jgi:L-arabinonolactonase
VKAELIDRVAVGNVLGEGVLWDHERGCAWWTDIEQRRLYRYTLKTRAIEHIDLPERLGSFGFICGSERLIAAFESGFAYLHPETKSVEWIVRPTHDAKNIRLNDGRVDRQGRFWVGSMVEGKGEPKAKLYCLVKGRLEVHLTGIAISNSLCFSSNGHMYFADTPNQTILRFDLDPITGAMSHERVFARTSSSAYPDGSTIDAEGCLWNAQWGSGRIVRYAPDGAMSRAIKLPVTQPSCVAFGGDNLDLLFVTTARQGLRSAELAKQPYAGNLFIFQLDTTGEIESRYREW